MFRDSPDRRPPADLALGLTFNANTVADCSGRGNVGTLNDGATISGGVLVLDGGNDDLSFPDAAALDMPSAFTVSAWVEPSSPGSVPRYIASRYVNSGTNRSWAFLWRYDVAGTPIQSSVAPTGSGVICQYMANTTLPTSGWHHTAMVWNASASAGARATFYLDGVNIAVTSVSSDGAYTPFDPTGIATTIGSQNTTATGGWKGNMDDVFIFRRALTANEIKQIYYRGRS